MSVFFIVALGSCIVALALLVGRFAWQRRRHGQEIVPPVLFLSTGLSAIILPILYAVLTGRFDFAAGGVPLHSWAVGLALEVIFLACVILGYLAVRQSQPAWLQKATATCRSTPVPRLWLILVVTGLWFMALLFSGEWSTWGYGQANARLRLDPTDPGLTLGAIQRYAEDLLLPLGAVLLVTKGTGDRLVSALMKAFVLLLIVAPAAAAAAVSGGRGDLLEIGLVGFVLLYWKGRRRLAAALLVAGLVGLLLISPAIRSYRMSTYTAKELTVAERLELLGSSLVTPKGSGDRWSESIQRFDLAQNGGNLALHAYDDGYVGFRPYHGAVLSFLPRAVFPDRPMPLSATGDIRGEPHFLAAAIKGQPWNSVGVSASGISFWQLGLIGVVAAGLLNGAIIYSFASLGFRGGVVGIALMLATFNRTFFLLVAPLDAWLTYLQQTTGPLVLSLALYVLVVRIGKSSRSSAVMRRPRRA